MGFIGTDSEYTVEDYLNAVTANLILNKGPEPINAPHNQNWIHGRTTLIQMTFVGAAQKWFLILPIEINMFGNDLIKNFQKCLTEGNKKHQKVLCNEKRRLPNET